MVGCEKRAHFKRLCRQHGGGIKCCIDGCEKWAQRERMCLKHFTILWTFMVFLHVVCAVFLLSCAKLYYIMESKYNDYFADLLAPARDRHFRVVGTVLGVLGGAHALQLFTHLGISTTARRLTMVEMATQVPNAYLYSKLITRSWINHTKVTLVVVNCWSAFVIHKKLSTRKTRSQISMRLTAVVIDTLLAVATGILLPSAIVIPYLVHFDFKTLDFPDAMLYGDTAFPNLVLENRAFFATSWDNAIMKIVPHVNAFFCLQVLASMLDCASHGPRVSTMSSGPPPLMDFATSWDNAIMKIVPHVNAFFCLQALASMLDCAPRGPRVSTMSSGPPPLMEVNKKRSIIIAASFRALTQVTNTLHRVTRLRQLYRVAVPLIFLITGGIVLALHLTAQYDNVKDARMMSRMCLQRMHPWLAPNSSCAVVKYNCHKESMATPNSEVFDWIEREAVRKIIFMHCPAFFMPAIIREFPSLMIIELWNMTLVRWGVEAAVSAKLHPMMICVYFSLVNLTSVPAGIIQTDLPEHLTDIEFSRTNLTALPKEIAHAWRGIKVLYVERSRLNSFPPFLLQLPVLSELSLIDNNIKTLPENAFSTGLSPFYYDLALSRNPLVQLPDRNLYKLNVSIFNFALEYTQLTDLPAWIDSTIRVSLSLGGSPICNSSRNRNLPKFVHCGQDNRSWDPIGEERFPTKFLEPFRSLQA
ncbi:hypothetical protein PHMEG_00025427 [Phytophthora megakarya]|uniref:TKL protein kinase n=1 Tax=Phytophthora megakarya TaxID=4795 RepID=A0A225VDA6_9STRA|nr:hypothetical protein PHMEG_00025427 [Phytophthora megakarya]